MREKLLVVDDDSIARRNIAEFLSDQGFAVEDTPNGTKALEKVQNQYFDLVLTDVVMPGMSGLDLTARVHSVSPATPVIIMTGNTAIDLNKARSVGAASFIRKPLILEEVLNEITQLLASR